MDPITNLHTNTEFTKSIHRLVEEQTNACVIKLGIEHFRRINAMYGQQGGNQVLRLYGGAVLLCWKQRPFGVVPPDPFIPWLKNAPVFIQAGNWVLRQVIEETRSLR